MQAHDDCFKMSKLVVISWRFYCNECDTSCSQYAKGDCVMVMLGQLCQLLMAVLSQVSQHSINLRCFSVLQYIILWRFFSLDESQQMVDYRDCRNVRLNIDVYKMFRQPSIYIKGAFSVELTHYEMMDMEARWSLPYRWSLPPASSVPMPSYPTTNTRQNVLGDIFARGNAGSHWCGRNYFPQKN